MAKYDVVIRGGTVVDGTGGPRRVADVAISDGRVAMIGDAPPGAGREEIDARGLIVAPGVIDLHTHYDAQLHWDPYCTTSGWHGTTTAIIGNCGFGFAPLKAGMQDRYMRMMENTEQIPYDVMKRSMPFDWESLPDWLEHLRRLPKGINVATYLPMNALLSYVIGPDEAKTRPATEAERARMREILHEAMDAGAWGFSFSHLGAEGNSHVDHDFTAMPSDVMAAEEAYNLADVLRERGEGVIQILCELPGMAEPRRKVAEELARRSGCTVLHNITVPSDVNPESHRSVLRWLDEVIAQGLNIWTQSFCWRKWLDITPLYFNAWDSVPIFRTLTAAPTAEAKVALVGDADYRARFAREYDPAYMQEAGGRLEAYTLREAPGTSQYDAFLGHQLQDISAATGRPVTELFLDLIRDTGAQVLFTSDEVVAHSTETITELLSHPRVLVGVSDGGAHSKHGNGGFWSTDLLIWLGRETDVFPLEHVHHLMSGRNAQVFGLKDRGELREGYAADIMIYDLDRLGFEVGRYEIVHDLPGGDWRKITRAEGIRHILVNGRRIFTDNVCSGETPGQLLTPGGGQADQSARLAAE
ncbi:amidohydrolase family protein [Phenylobacterium sp.]|uniref:N-acyl-D-amino-acid deacylase family protein n=1 Tax=Phenylobacterium sp. TaxID=1871053 RepID=UPI00301BAD70